MDLKAKLKEARKSTKVALVGGAVVVAGTWGSCQFQYAEHSEPEATPDPWIEESEALIEELSTPEKKPEAEEAEPAAVEG